MERPTPEELQYQYEHYDESYVPQVRVSMSICIALATVAVVLRVIARRMNNAALGHDDRVIVFALFFAASYVTGNFVSIHYGGFRHIVAIEHPIRVGKLIVAIEVLYQPAITCVKLSCLLLLYRIFPSRRLHIILWCVGIVVMLYATIGVFTAVFACRPIRAAWDFTVERPKCLVDLNLFFLVQAVFNVITDFVILALPMPLLWRLQLPRNRKLQVIGIFLTGSFVCAVSIWRVPHMKLANSDASYLDGPAFIWSGVEICIGIVGACLPTLGPIISWTSKSISKNISRRTSTVGSDTIVPNTRDNSRSFELGVGKLRSPSATYVPPTKGVRMMARIEATPFQERQVKNHRLSDHYWRLSAGDRSSGDSYV